MNSGNITIFMLVILIGLGVMIISISQYGTGTVEMAGNSATLAKAENKAEEGLARAILISWH